LYDPRITSYDSLGGEFAVYDPKKSSDVSLWREPLLDVIIERLNMHDATKIGKS
jgi:hypothetical protein